ncbi:MAG TPA: biotin synthase BioB [Spirochaetota bacterium]|nr:biotin synthase BioB [Spirochaetota bacterium]
MLSRREAFFLYTEADQQELLAGANRIRQQTCGNFFEMCSIINARSGRCSEDCRFCAQSGYYQTDIETYTLLDYESIAAAAANNEKAGVHRFSIVTSGKKLSASMFKQIADIFKKLNRQFDIKLCASLGLVTADQARILQQCGVEHYHHNLETSRAFFPNICTTHTYDHRLQTIRNVQQTGMTVCSGGIIGLGESVADRIELALTLRQLSISSVPVNVLVPVKGTPLAQQPLLQPQEILRTIAVYRFILPNAFIRYAGGRNNLKQYDRTGLEAGINAALVGELLTTVGKDIAQDKQMIRECGFSI